MKGLNDLLKEVIELIVKIDSEVKETNQDLSEDQIAEIKGALENYKKKITEEYQKKGDDIANDIWYEKVLRFSKYHINDLESRINYSSRTYKVLNPIVFELFKN